MAAQQKIKLVDISFNYYADCDSPEAIAEQTKTGYGYADHIGGDAEVVIIKHINYEGEQAIYGRRYAFFRKQFGLPLAALRFIKAERANVVLVQGLGFPLQLMFLHFMLGRQVKIIVQHHGEQPFRRKKILQRWADKFTDAYLFTASDNVQPWIDAGIIASRDKCFEVLEASTLFHAQERAESLRRTGMNGEKNFLWVGRLNANKNPLTMLEGFGRYAESYPFSKLYMIFQETDLLEEVEAYINNKEALQKSVVLVGKVAHEALEYWVSAADYYISASHREGSGYALIEAMACGCIPVVTDIPSFRKITGEGKFGHLYTAGDAGSLTKCLSSLHENTAQLKREEVIRYFQHELSFSKIAVGIIAVCRKLLQE